MPNTREKLIELLFECQNECYSIFCNECEYFGKWRCLSQWQTDHLIANGVRLERKQSIGNNASDESKRWIPVTERLPDYDGCYIVTACDEGCPSDERIWDDTVVVVAEYYDDGRWVWYEGVTEYDLCDIVTHWMPLPEPPKGE